MRRNQHHRVALGRASLTVCAVILTASLASAASPKWPKTWKERRVPSWSM
jgi:hypothetical protein